MKARAVAMWVAGLALVAALATVLWLVFLRTPPVRIASLPAQLPRATAGAESILPAALEDARALAAGAGARALLVNRRGHRVFEYFARDRDRDHLVDGGQLATLGFALALRGAAPEQVRDASAAAVLVSERLWLPLRADDAWLSGGTQPVPRRCCIRARLDDWMRLGDLLLDLGTLQGERIVSADEVRQVLGAHSLPVWHGDEPLLARDAQWFDLEPGIRLWLVPRRRLAVLVWADEQSAYDTLVPNIILRGLNDQAPAIDGGVGDLVPGH